MFILLWYVHIAPYLIDIPINYLPYSLEVIPSVIEISQNEKQLFGGLLSKQFKVDLKDNLKQAVVGGPVPANIGGPHVDEEDICDGEGEEGCRLLESHPLLSSLLRVRTFNVEYQDRAVGVARHPDALGCLGTAYVGVHDIELGIKQKIEQGTYYIIRLLIYYSFLKTNTR